MTQQQALASAFAPPANVTRQSVFLTKAQAEAAKKESGVAFGDQLVVRYVAITANRVTGYAYFDTHRVRTVAETIMIVVTPEGAISRVDVLSFDEPPDYLPRERWLEQFRRQKLGDDLSLKGAIRPMSGASLTGRAIVNASRKVLALHRAIGPASPQ
jgi:Na+-translocating ferredoxin:NAD+ oxidoreductase RnfG subunit